jgi:GNAT superfamily N-acetyltransferase
MASREHSALTLRLARDDEADRAFLYSLFAATRAAELAREFLLKAQYRSMTESYRQDYPDARWEVGEHFGEPVGRLVTDVGASRVLYVDIALMPQARGHGLATRLMTLALDEPRRLDLPARVNVLMDNIASLKLCARLGFVRLGESPPFVRLECAQTPRARKRALLVGPSEPAKTDDIGH